MGEQMEKKFTWVSQKLTSVLDDKCYSHPFKVAGCYWRLLASPKGENNNYLSLYLELVDPESLPPGWRRQVKLRLTLVNKGWRNPNKVLGGQHSFDAKSNRWGFEEFLPLDKLLDTRERFLVNYRLIILVEVHVLPPIVVPEQPVKIIEPPSNKQGNQVSDISVSKSLGDSDISVSKSQGDSSCQMAVKTEYASKENLDNDDASEEGSDDDDDDDTSDEGADDDDDDDASSFVSEDGGRDISLLNQSNSFEDVSHTVGNHGICGNSVAAETEVSNSDNDDAPKEHVNDDASSLVSNDSARDGSSVDQVKSLEDASQTVVTGNGRGFNTVASVTETSNNVLKEIQPVKETMDVNGFEVFSSQVELVSHIFKRHPDMAIGFRPKNKQIRRAYINALLNLIETLCQSPEKLSEDDLTNADDTLVDLIDAGFKLDWLKTKLDEVSQKKKMEQGSGARLQTMEEQLQNLKLLVVDLESQLHKEKVEALAARAPLSFINVVS